MEMRGGGGGYFTQRLIVWNALSQAAMEAELSVCKAVLAGSLDYMGSEHCVEPAGKWS